jgi:hypothetical protein
MGKIGKTYAGAGGRAQYHSLATLARLDRPLSSHQERVMRRQLMASVVTFISVLGFVGWVLAL